MSDRDRQWAFGIGAALIVFALVILTFTVRGQDNPAKTRKQGSGRPVVITPVATQTGKIKPAKGPAEVDPDDTDSKLRLDHKMLLRERPFFQHLPYRDHKIGVDVVNVTQQGKLLILVTYIGDLKDAKQDLQRVLARFHDPGTAYEVQYKAVFK